MRSLLLLAFAALFAVAIGCKGKQSSAVGAPSERVWEPIFFKSINERASSCGLKPLRGAMLPEEACEIRVWAGFGLQPYPAGGHPLEGIVIKKHADGFSGVHYPRSPTRRSLVPLSGWAAFWEQLESALVFELPDMAGLDGIKVVRDGISYVVEVKRDGVYRTYMYGNPEIQDVAEAKQFLELLSILKVETGFGAGP